ncbi:hypothetical protein [Reichenbachiella sp. MSK19-1]|uniref:hypothetical protein n=1 Tax=Reichenbachiella sp. MSK19-1 TaxID=1897631 RepID=UPI000E6BFAA4|nr:hypothetical protein [Reichenbachiella sp. MSK19-1]RJE71521.1 hypothetical protein BGP76_05330 [Reichenbachiella sp. MSK19-1]
MKLEKILDHLNSFEKNSFLKIIDTIIAQKPKKSKQIDKILNNASGDLKAMDSINISEVFELLKDEFSDYLKHEFLVSTSQIDILSDILIRDGNCIMKQDWLCRLYETELKQLKKKIGVFKAEIENEKSTIEALRKRDYITFRACVNTAFTNDDLNNQERKITFDEQTILNTLSSKLELSNEEIKLINYMVVPLVQLEIDSVISEMKNLGVLFFSRKTNMVYIADEIVTLVRKLKGKEVADKYFRRVLRQIREPQINMICKKHNIDWKQTVDLKIKEIINEGISFTGVLSNDIFKEGVLVTEKKKFINELCDSKLKLNNALKGATVDEKLESVIRFFEEVEADDKVGISIEGYEKMLLELSEILPKTKIILKNEFELQEENIMKSAYLLDYNIKPRDVLEVIPETDLEIFCEKVAIKTRGDLLANILENYKDAENLYLENYASVGYRDLATLKENGIIVKESELGILFEDLTKTIFTKLGFTVNEDLRKKLNTSKDKMDMVISISEQDIILLECKSVKESGYNKFSSVSRQLKSYIGLAEKNGYKVIKSLLIAPEFSDDFVKECGLDYELNLSLITAKSLTKILEGLKVSKHKSLPHNLLMRDVLIQEDRIMKSIGK